MLLQLLARSELTQWGVATYETPVETISAAQQYSKSMLAGIDEDCSLHCLACIYLSALMVPFNMEKLTVIGTAAN